MKRVVVVTTSYPQNADDAQGHFVAAEVRALTRNAEVTVLAPGRARPALGDERVVSLGGDEAFGFPGALARLRARPLRALAAAQFTLNAVAWLRRRPAPDALVAHFLLPCGVPIATRGLLPHASTQLDVVVHGSDARLFAQLPGGQAWLGRELLRAGAELRFVSEELRSLVLGALPERQRLALSRRSRVEPCAIDTSGVPARRLARAALGFAEQRRLAVVVSRLVTSKRVEVALQACALIPNLETVVVGDGPERSRLARTFPQARFVGHTGRRAALTYIAAADVLVCASRAEGAPSVVREARALGTEVVCLQAGDLALWAERDPGLHVVR